MTLIRHLIADHPEYHRAALSRQGCRLLQWYKADGGLKEMSCRVAMLRMQADDETPLSAGPTPCANATCHWSSIMPASLFCPGSRLKTWPPEFSQWP